MCRVDEHIDGGFPTRHVHGNLRSFTRRLGYALVRRTSPALRSFIRLGSAFGIYVLATQNQICKEKHLMTKIPTIVHNGTILTPANTWDNIQDNVVGHGTYVVGTGATLSFLYGVDGGQTIALSNHPTAGAYICQCADYRRSDGLPRSCRLELCYPATWCTCGERAIQHRYTDGWCCDRQLQLSQ